MYKRVLSSWNWIKERDLGIGGVYYISEPIRMCRRWEIAPQLNFNLTHSLRSNLSHHNVSQENHAWQLIYAVHPDDLVKPREPASPRVSPSNERESVLSCRLRRGPFSGLESCGRWRRNRSTWLAPLSVNLLLLFFPHRFWLQNAIFALQIFSSNYNCSNYQFKISFKGLVTARPRF